MKYRYKKWSQVRFVLVRPRNPLNIGAVARAMANFGFNDLVVVDPYQPVMREVKSAVGAGPVMKKARVVKTLKTALKGCHWVLGTSAGTRRIIKGNWISPHSLFDNAGPKKRLAVLLGSEKSGLSNHDLSCCQQVLRIPTASSAPSMNLGQAAALVAYMLNAGGGFEKPKSKNAATLPVDQVERLVQQGIEACEMSGIFKGWERKTREEQLRRAFYNWNLGAVDKAMLHGIFRWIINKSKLLTL